MSTHLFVYETLCRDHLAWIAATGFTCIELFAGKPHFEFDDDAVVDRLETWLGETGLNVSTLHLPFYSRFGSEDFHYVGPADKRDEVREEMAGYMRRLLDIAQRLGCRRAVLHLQSEKTFDEKNLDLFHREMQWLAPVCREHRVDLLLENIMTESTRTAALVELCKQYPDVLGICLDLGHANVVGPVAQEIADGGEWIRNLHVHDNQGDNDDHALPGTGTIDWPATLTALDRHAPNLEYFTFELSLAMMGDAASETAYRQLMVDAADFWQHQVKERR